MMLKIASVSSRVRFGFQPSGKKYPVGQGNVLSDIHGARQLLIERADLAKGDPFKETVFNVLARLTNAADSMYSQVFSNARHEPEKEITNWHLNFTHVA